MTARTREQLPSWKLVVPSPINSNSGRQALTVKELTALLNVGKSAIYEMAKAGRIPHIRLGSIVRFDPATTAAWLRQQTIGTGILGVA
jgi:excisionase family DNA binding protein